MVRLRSVNVAQWRSEISRHGDDLHRLLSTRLQ